MLLVLLHSCEVCYDSISIFYCCWSASFWASAFIARIQWYRYESPFLSRLILTRSCLCTLSGGGLPWSYFACACRRRSCTQRQVGLLSPWTVVFYCSQIALTYSHRLLCTFLSSNVLLRILQPVLSSRRVGL